MRVVPVAFLVGLLGAASAQQPYVLERVQWPVGGFSFYRDLHLGDVDADGHLDLIDVGPDRIDVARGLGGFGFGPAVHTVVGESPRSLSVGHVDGDGFLDAVVRVVPFAWHADIQLGDGSGAFTPAGSLAVTNFTDDLLLAEVTGDGFDDLIVLTGEAGVGAKVLVCASDGSGGLATPVAASVPDLGVRLLLGDVVEDGAADVVVAYTLNSCLAGPTYVTLQSDGAGHLSLASSACLAGGAWAADLGDIDGDGHLDLLGNGPFGPTNSDVRAFLGSGDGSFTTQLAVGSGTTRPIAADVTGDGLIDVVGQTATAGSVTWPALGGGAFGPRRDSALMPVEVLADLDGDGLADAAGANPEGTGTVVAPNRGDGTWDAVLASGPPGAFGFRDTALGDFDGDGRLDVAQISSGVWTMQGRGDGTFAAGSFGSAGLSQLLAVSVGDATNDGNDDVLALNASGHGHLLVGHGDGTFAPSLLFAGLLTIATDGLVADLDGDGHADIIECGGPSAVVVYLGAALGGWQAPKGYPGAASQLALADFDQDGLLDVVASSNVFFNVGHGALAPAQPLHPGTSLIAVASADFDEDGLPDVAGVRSKYSADPALVLLFGLGDGAFEPAAFEPLPTSDVDLAAADLDRDGHADLLLSSLGRELALRRGDGAGNFVLDSFLAPLDVVGSIEARFDIGDVNGDEWPDVVLTQDTGVMTLVNQLGVWHDLGFAFNQATGKAAQLSGGGPLQAGSPVILHLGRARPGADVAIVIGVAQAMLPFKGGVMVPSFDLLVPGLVADGHGNVVLEATLPVALPTGSELFFQAFVEDQGAPAGIAPSNALEARAP
jgi:trimeric autotransporter adhesin